MRVLLSLLTIGWAFSARTTADLAPMCALDMGSNTFKRIVGSFEKGRYEQRAIERKTLGVGDDVVRTGSISDRKLAEIEETLAAFKASCEKDGAPTIAAIGTAVFREAPNGRRAVEIAARLGIPMEIATAQRESELAYLVGCLGQTGCAVIDNGSRSIELVARDGADLRYTVFNQGYRIAYQTFFVDADDLAGATRAFQARLEQEISNVPFMRGKAKLVGLEFGEMADGLFEPAPLEGRVLTVLALRARLRELTATGADGFKALKKQKDIDRTLPRLVAAIVLADAFGYTQIELSERELGSALIIEAGAAKR